MGRDRPGVAGFQRRAQAIGPLSRLQRPCRAKDRQDIARSCRQGGLERRALAETKEHLGGFLLIEAKDLAEAMEIAERDSLARMGAIEVRETAGF